MTSSILTGFAIALATVFVMEGVAYTVHRYVMHGIGWSLHRSHHRPRSGPFEANDAFGLMFAALSLALILRSTWREWPYWIGIGMALYGLLYALLHDGLVHRRFPFVHAPRRGYLLRLIKAHHIHHAVRTREGAVSFGFLYAPPVEALAKRVRQRLRD
ncbi:sterol desaturase family protein [Sphingomonas montanisoli]|uniref:Beta-carotene hydroxylase n=1 Tax=Sphingomonas montanisoli TaxID=2606412 RepID=A0A5D9C761_9SPHN|nr:sterol desaturase family protein [Sphingomonas montanisoli]TZG27306.1 beta-carotene hydroxylase [Sphingomonas montanisoli]